jgi:hypothetical protein
MKKQWLTKALEDWHKQMEAAAEDGIIDEAEAEALRKDYERIVTNANEEYKRKMDALGIDISKEDEDKENSLKGAYAKASQESIDLLAGQTGAARKTLEEILSMLNSRMVVPDGWHENMLFGVNAIPELIASGMAEVQAIKELNARIAASNDAIVANTQRIGAMADDLSAMRGEYSDAFAALVENTVGIADVVEAGELTASRLAGTIDVRVKSTSGI